MSKELHINFFTANYPYTKSEAYIENEMPLMAEHCNSISIFPMDGFEDPELREIPENCKIERVQLDNSDGFDRKDSWKLILILLTEFRYTNKKVYYLKNLGEMRARLKKAFSFAKKLEKEGFVKKGEAYYSYWMNEWATVLMILKRENKIDHFFFRCGGFDIWDERSPGNYLPFRGTIYKYCSGVFPNSKGAETYLRAKNLFPSKVHHQYWGTVDHGIAPFNKEEQFTIVSCSNVIPLKRIHLIIDILEKLSFKVKWVHFGDGADLDKTMKYAEKIKDQHDVTFTGLILNTEIYQFYKENTVHLFITTSETEGLPVSIQEATSFGIPIVATNVGGMPEVVNENTGILIDPSVDIEQTAQIIENFKDSDKNSIQFRKGVRSYWFEKFEAKSTYNKFYQEIKKLVQ